jgi:hypothetical protein
MHITVDTFAGAVTNVTSYDYSIRMFPHPDIAFASAVATAGPFIFFAALMFNFVLQVGAVVVEKELKLRESMRVMGLIVRCWRCCTLPYLTTDQFKLGRRLLDVLVLSQRPCCIL